MKRVYTEIIQNHFDKFEQMVFLSGPRQAGKTTISLSINPEAVYYNWDIDADRVKILKGVHALAPIMEETLGKKKPTLIFDEIHKYDQWKQFLKGFIDTYKGKVDTIVTGSSKLDIYKKGGDSLMGRYVLYHVHPLTIGECLNTALPKTEIRQPASLSYAIFNQLLTFGGFPEPFLQQDKQFLMHWQRLRRQQLFYEDIRALSQVQELAKIELLAEYLKLNASAQVNLTRLSNKVNVAGTTIERWVGVLQQFFYCFIIRPWSKNISRSLLKEPKVFLWNWADIEDEGARFENFVALHLLKATQLWMDFGLGEYGLYYLRDKEKNEVDFCVTKNGLPWFLVEVKLSAKQGISKALHHFQKQTKAAHAFQVVRDMDFVDEDCFAHHEPIKVPALTFLSQLL